MLKKRILVVILTVILIPLLVGGKVFSQEILSILPAKSFQQAACANTIFDEDFVSGWEDESDVTDDPLVPGIGPGTSSFAGSSVPTSGGNPGSYRKTTHTIFYGDRIYTGGLYTTAVYTPSVAGVTDRPILYQGS